MATPQVLHNHIFSVWSSCKLTARCSLLFQRRISLFASICALSCRRIGRENCWWYSFLPLGEAKSLTVKSSGHILNRLSAKERAQLLYCSQQKASLFCKSLRISRIGLRKLKEVMVLGRNMSVYVFHKDPGECS